MLPNKKHEFSAGRQAGGLPFSAASPAFSAARFFVQSALLSFVQSAESSRFSFGNMAL